MRYSRIFTILCFCFALPLSAGTAYGTSVEGIQVMKPSPAQPVAAFFYPNEVRLTVEEKLRPSVVDNGVMGFILTLPASAPRATFSAIIDGEPVGGYWQDHQDAEGDDTQSRTLVPALETSPERRALLKLLESLQTERAKSEGMRASLEVRIELWKKGMGEKYSPVEEKIRSAQGKSSAGGKNAPFSLDEMSKLDAQMADRIPSLYAAYAKEKGTLDEVMRRYNDVENKITKYDEAHKYQHVILPWAGDTQKMATLRYEYSVEGRLNTTYRVSAYPAKDSLEIEQKASLWQASGFTWSNVDVTLSTARRDTALQPPNPRSWNISVAAPQSAKLREAAPMLETAIARDDNVEESALSEQRALLKATPPVQEEKATFRLWKLGKRTIVAETPVQVPLAIDKYKASYNYTMRPASSPKGFLTAELDLPTPLELPHGMAQMYVDGTALGELQFSFNGTKGTIFFGSDPQVTAQMRDIKRSTGAKGIISKEQTVQWQWEILVKNARRHPVRVLVEDAAPQTRDDAIKLIVTSTPKPEEVTTAPEQGGIKIFRWNATLQPDATTSINHTVEVSAPEDKSLNPGRGVR